LFRFRFDIVDITTSVRCGNISVITNLYFLNIIICIQVTPFLDAVDVHAVAGVCVHAVTRVPAVASILTIAGVPAVSDVSAVDHFIGFFYCVNDRMNVVIVINIVTQFIKFVIGILSSASVQYANHSTFCFCQGQGPKVPYHLLLERKSLYSRRRRLRNRFCAAISLVRNRSILF